MHGLEGRRCFRSARLGPPDPCGAGRAGWSQQQAVEALRAHAGEATRAWTPWRSFPGCASLTSRPPCSKACTGAVEQLNNDYSHVEPAVLVEEGRRWLNRLIALHDGRLSLEQHREVLSLAGQVARLVGCVEYDMGRKAAAEATRRAALTLGKESGNSDVVGWAHEMRCWYSLTEGNYRAAIAAA